jgi:hypothetical protein
MWFQIQQFQILRKDDIINFGSIQNHERIFSLMKLNKCDLRMRIRVGHLAQVSDMQIDMLLRAFFSDAGIRDHQIFGICYSHELIKNSVNKSGVL